MTYIPLYPQQTYIALHPTTHQSNLHNVASVQQVSIEGNQTSLQELRDRRTALAAEFEERFKGATETGECCFSLTLDEELEICFEGGTSPRSERWLVCKTVRLNERLFKLMNDDPNSDFQDLIPLAGVAVRLDQTAPTNGTVSCTLPLPIESGLPVQVCPCPLLPTAVTVVIVSLRRPHHFTFVCLRSMDGSSCDQIVVRSCTRLVGPTLMAKQWSKQHGTKS